MAQRIAPLVFALFIVLLGGASAFAAPTVTIIGTLPADGVIGKDETATIYWKIDSTGSGTYRVEVGGDGTSGSGTLVEASNGEGDYSGTTTGSTTISAANDLDNVDGDYAIYVIAVEGEETASAFTTIHLQAPPTIVTGLLVQRGDTKLFVSWDASIDTDIDHYLLYYATHSGAVAADYDGIGAAEGDSPIDAGNATEAELTGLINEVKYYIRISAVDDTGAEGPLSEERSGTPTATEAFAQLQGDEGECFVATAAFGADHAMVRNLRAWRDQVLRNSEAGRWFIRTYYRVSPPLAGWIAHRPLARAVARTVLSPVAWAAGLDAKHPGSISVTLLLMLGAVWLAARQRRGNGDKA
jgi:hypothetical protein